MRCEKLNDADQAFRKINISLNADMQDRRVEKVACINGM